MAIAREQIIDVALALLDAGGIENVTTRRLADKLGVQQPALYWHFRNKSELMDALNERIMADGHTRRSPIAGESWQDFVRENARSFRRSLLAHRDGARVHAGTHPAPSDLAGIEAQLRLYLAAGFSPQLALEAGIAIGRYVVGSVLEEQSDDLPSFTEEQADKEFAGYPLLRDTVKAFMLDDPAKSNERAFEAGLELIVGGLEAQLAKG